MASLKDEDEDEDKDSAHQAHLLGPIFGLFICKMTSYLRTEYSPKFEKSPDLQPKSNRAEKMNEVNWN